MICDDGSNLPATQRAFHVDEVKENQVTNAINFTSYSGDLNSELVRYLNGPKQFARRMVCYSSHDLNSELIVRYSGHRVFD